MGRGIPPGPPRVSAVMNRRNSALCRMVSPQVDIESKSLNVKSGCLVSNSQQLQPGAFNTGSNVHHLHQPASKIESNAASKIDSKT
jgi:hypothetical protein